MNILEINKFYYLRRGAERHFLDVIRLLKEKKHKVAAFSMRHPLNEPSEWEKFFVSYVGYNRDDSTVAQRLIGTLRMFWSFEARRKIRMLLREFHPDVVHLHNIYHQISPSILGSLKQSGAKIVLTVHDYALISPDKDCYYPEVGHSFWKFLLVKKYGIGKRLLLVLKMYWERFFGFYAKNVDVFIVPSEFVKATLLAGGIAKEKVAVIPHFLFKDVAVTQNSECGRANVKQEKPFALYLGAVSKEKGVPELVRMFDRLRIPLVIAGSLEGNCVLPKSDFARFVGKKSAREAADLMKRAACVVSASSLPETFGLIALESIAIGKPFFGLKSGALPEIIENGKNGFLTSSTKNLQKTIGLFFAGDLHFDEETVAEYAKEKYGEGVYYSRIQALFSDIDPRS